MKSLNDFFNPQKKETLEEIVEQKNNVAVDTVFNTLYASKFDTILNEIKNCTTKEEVQNIAMALIEHVEHVQKELQKEVKNSTNSLQEKTNLLNKKLSELNSLKEEEDRKNKAFVYEAVLRQEESTNKTLAQVNDLAVSKIESLEEAIKSDINSNLEKFTKRYNQDLREYQSQLKKQSIDVERIEESLKTFIVESKKFLSDEKYIAINKKIHQLENILENFNEKTILVENILNAPASLDTSDPLTPLDQNFVTHEQLVKHYQLFINRVQQQLTTLGGGGAAWLNDLQDVNYDAVKSATDGQVLTYNAANALWEVSTVSGGGATFDQDLNTSNSVTFAEVAAANVNVTGKSKFGKIAESFSGILNPSGVTTFDCNNTHIFNVTSINTNFTANIVNLDLNNSEATSITLVLNQGGTAYIANAVQIAGATQTVKWQANSEPTGNVNAVDIQTFSILNVGGSYTVLGQLTTFG